MSRPNRRWPRNTIWAVRCQSFLSSLYPTRILHARVPFAFSACPPATSFDAHRRHRGCGQWQGGAGRLEPRPDTFLGVTPVTPWLGWQLGLRCASPGTNAKSAHHALGIAEAETTGCLQLRLDAAASELGQRISLRLSQTAHSFRRPIGRRSCRMLEHPALVERSCRGRWQVRRVPRRSRQLAPPRVVQSRPSCRSRGRTPLQAHPVWAPFER
jgi:hypothetical protein